ncbi:YqcI/YcgG family protein [Frankia sp. AiPs1]|uniref:YqcI/YcgG family protein n=1 Tax=Frankia sp. AiPs1 TaxID=573493 RepID=UPI002043D21E|nr:YqcI/YcgG family protein [Frankia sp. AiPs1]MCM3924466.1 YqcI/YcgG family protein [Frankia sp. AiPs1]
MRDTPKASGRSTAGATDAVGADSATDTDSATDALREEILDLAIGPMPGWGAGCARDIMATLKSDTEPFPCVFAVAAAHKGGLRFGFVEDLRDERTWSVLPDILATYLSVYQSISRDTSLVVFFGSGGPTAGPDNDDVLSYEQRFWSILSYLHDSDGEPWPSDIPTDTDDPGWEFSFRGTPIFVVCNTPAHRRLRSRSNPVFTITFQPRWVFTGLEPTSPRGAAARKIIRERLARMDEVDSTPLLGSYGDPANREWKQYYLRDDASVADSCPLHAGSGRRPADITAGTVTVETSRAVAGESVAESARPARPARTEPAATGPFKVVVNQEQQYSVWPHGRPNALGWFDTPVTGSRQHCLDSIELTWADMRPRSLRRRMAGHGGAGSSGGAARVRAGRYGVVGDPDPAAGRGPVATSAV